MQKLNFGVSYYPEHWEQARWAEDIRLMKEAHINVVRMGEFAWSTLEPAEGQFRLEWLAQTVEMLAEAGIQTVLGTPTASPPAWLVQKYPSALSVTESGRKTQFGNRCHYCVNSPDYHAAARRIVRALAERFGKSPHVIGWQVDNEFNQVCYCEHCQAEFQSFLREQYGTLDQLNACWTTAYWSQTYSDWAQIPLPIGGHNPGLITAFKHFVTRSYQRFQQIQLDELRPHLHSSAWVTHNFMGWSDVFDTYQLARALDMASWDWYIIKGHHDYLSSGVVHDLARGFKKKNYWLMETQPGNISWGETNHMLNKMEARVMAWHSVAHGGDGLLYWQWRSALNGQEQFHGTVIDQSGRPRPFYDEVKMIGREFERVSDLIIGSTVQSKVAMLNCYESQWSLNHQPHHPEFNYVNHFKHWHRPLARHNLNVDILSADETLEGYSLVIAPALIFIDEVRAAKLTEYVQAGGLLVLTLRTGMKDRHNAFLPMRQPGFLSALAGVEVQEYHPLENSIPVAGDLFQGTASIWAESLLPLDAQITVLARYGASNGWLDGQPAVTIHPFGKGFVYTVGAYLDEKSMNTLMESILNEAGLKSMVTPADVEIRTRTRSDGVTLYFVLNHSRMEKEITLPWLAMEHLSPSQIPQRKLNLPPYGVALLTQEGVHI